METASKLVNPVQKKGKASHTKQAPNALIFASVSLNTEIMSFFRWGKTVKPQQFNYIPRYYDPEKEERDARIAAIMGQSSKDPEDIKARISKNYRARSVDKKNIYKSQAMRSNLILVGVLIALILLAYIMLVKYMPMIERWLAS